MLDRRLGLLVGGLIVSGVLIAAFVHSKFVGGTLVALVCVAGTAGFIVLLGREDARIRKSLVKVSEAEAIAIGREAITGHGWSLDVDPKIRLRFSRPSGGDSPTWEIKWTEDRSSVSAWIDVQTGEVVKVNSRC